MPIEPSHIIATCSVILLLITVGGIAYRFGKRRHPKIKVSVERGLTTPQLESVIIVSVANVSEVSIRVSSAGLRTKSGKSIVVPGKCSAEIAPQRSELFTLNYEDVIEGFPDDEEDHGVIGFAIDGVGDTHKSKNNIQLP